MGELNMGFFDFIGKAVSWAWGTVVDIVTHPIKQLIRPWQQLVEAKADTHLRKHRRVYEPAPQVASQYGALRKEGNSVHKEADKVGQRLDPNMKAEIDRITSKGY